VQEGRAWREHAEEGPVAAAAAAGKEEEVGLVLQRRGRHVASSDRRGGVPCYVCTRNWVSLELFPECAAERRARRRERVVGVARGPQRRRARAHTLLCREMPSEDTRLLPASQCQARTRSASNHEASKSYCFPVETFMCLGF